MDKNAVSSEQYTRKIKILLLILIPLLLILIVSVSLIRDNWNSIMASKYCKTGDYQKAMEYYSEDINSGTASTKSQMIHNALSIYSSAHEALENDYMQETSQCISNLKKSKSPYPTDEEINELSKKYDIRIKEIQSFDDEIRKITTLSANPTNIEEVKTKCNELLNKNITKEQTNTINDILVAIVNKKIKEVENLFSDPNQIANIATKCDELLSE